MIKYKVINIPSNTGATWACRIYCNKFNNAPNLWFFYKTREMARNKLKRFKNEFNLAWFKRAMKD